MKKILVAVAFAAGLASSCFGSAVRDAMRDLRIDAAQWQLVSESENRIAWNARSGATVTLSVAARKSAMPDPRDAAALQGFFRAEAKAALGGIVEVESIELPAVSGALAKEGVLVTTKTPAKDLPELKASGLAWSYQVKAVFSRPDSTVTIATQAVEGQPTGMREAVLSVVLMKEKGITELSKYADQARKDPYDPKFDSEALYRDTDQQRFDKALPAHPATRARKLMAEALKPLTLAKAPAWVAEMGAWGPSAAEHTAIGVERQRAQDLDGAIASYTAALAVDAKHVPALGNRGGAKRAKGDIDGAIADFSRVLEINPRSAAAYFSRGDAKVVKSDWAGAIADYDAGIGIDPNQAATYRTRGMMKVATRDLDGAIGDLDRSLAMNANDSNAYDYRGRAKGAKGDYAGAMADFAKALEINPRLVSVLIARGSIKRGSGDIEGALADFETVLGLEPNNATALREKAAVIQAKGAK